ncbi:thiamine-monophosphate kinase [bacterium]|nr:thiamine-monophosphate kinase [bacterium]
MPDEFDLIAQLRQRAETRAPVEIGIGDDAAVLHHPHPTREVVTTDMLMDGVDFRWGEAPPELIGRKCLAVNLSDLAAMGARPTAAFVSVALPRTFPGQQIERMFQGLFDLAEEFEVVIAGGDTNSWDGPLVVSITAMGDVTEHGAVLRSGARPGDSIYVTGACGGSLQGRHLTFTPRVREALWLQHQFPLHAMIDISDGFAADLHHILDESGVGAIISGEIVPVHADIPSDWSAEQRLTAALSDGEDFELLFTTPVSDLPNSCLNAHPQTPITKVGVVTAEPGCWLRSESSGLAPLPKLGWKHALG